jgi:polysaccharide export outer membrane protein
MAVVVLGCLASFGAQAATLTGIGWQGDAALGVENLVFTFDGELPEIETVVLSSGLDIRLPGTSFVGMAPDDVKLSLESDGIHIEIDRPGSRLGAFRIDGSRVVLRLAAPSSEDGFAAGYRLGVGDEITVSVYRDEDLTGDYVIGQDGAINLPLVGPVTAVGLTESTLVDRLQEVLSDYLVDPQVSVTIRAFGSQFVYVTGSVARATRVAVRPESSLKDVLSEAGVALIPGQEIKLSRRLADGDGRTFVLDTEDLDGTDAPLPRDGDVITVQEPDYIFIRGEVRRAGRFIYTPGLTLQHAITLAEGLTDWASKKEIRIHRRDGDEVAVQRFDLRKVEKLKIPDPVLQPGDLILVGRRTL